MSRHAPTTRLVLVALALAAGASGAANATPPVVFHLEEATIDRMHAARRDGLVPAERLARMYLDRIAAYDRSGPRLGAFLHVDDDAPVRARELDTAPEPPGPLHGIPVLLKDNVDTADMPTTAGALALAGTFPTRDAFIVRRLRAAGAIILGKGRMTEFAHFVAHGTTVGVVSRTGIVPLSRDQDTAGPIARTVRDAAIVLGVIAGHDPEDPDTAACLVPDRCHGDYTRFLDADALRGARILHPGAALPGQPCRDHGDGHRGDAVEGRDHRAADDAPARRDHAGHPRVRLQA